jgi:hypothetical protein
VRLCRLVSRASNGGGLLLAGGGEDRARIVLHHHLKPGANVGSLLGRGIHGRSKIGHHEAARQFGDDLIHGAFWRIEMSREVTVETAMRGLASSAGASITPIASLVPWEDQHTVGKA